MDLDKARARLKSRVLASRKNSHPDKQCWDHEALMGAYKWLTIAASNDATAHGRTTCILASVP